MHQRYFTIEEAASLLPQLRELVGKQMVLRKEIEGAVMQLSTLLGKRVERVKVEADDPPDVRRLKENVLRLATEFQSRWNEVEELGVVVKDTGSGLLDFYSIIDGKTVFLCWQFDEGTIGHYHDLDAGFQGRKPIDASLRSRHVN